MRVLTVPNWSFGRNRTLLRRFESILSRADLKIHFLASDVDHNRSVFTYAGEPEAVVRATHTLIDHAYREVDMRAIPTDLRGFDFAWSSCALEHLGSLGAGMAFVAPGPRVTKAMPGRPVSRALASAIIVAPPSCRQTVTLSLAS